MAAMMMTAGESESPARALRRLAGAAVAAVLLRRTFSVSKWYAVSPSARSPFWLSICSPPTFSFSAATGFDGWGLAFGSKTEARMATARMKLLRNRREAQVRQMRRDIAALLRDKQEDTARIRVSTRHQRFRFLLFALQISVPRRNSGC
jgi:vacuolar protein sorting-associated protein IST1